MANRKKILFGLLVTLIFLAIGTAGFAMLEDYPVLDAFYMTVITISTVGFGEIHELSDSGRIFTIFLILFGFGSIGFLAHAFTEAIVERAASRNYGKRAMEKRIEQLNNHVIICGFGRMGAAATEQFHAEGSDFLIIETSEHQLKLIQELNYTFLEGDATREEVLLAAGIKRASSLLALLNSDPDNLFTVLTARELNPTLQIIARTEVATSESRMLRAGADLIVSPYASAGRSVARKTLSLESDAIPRENVDSQTNAVPQWLEVTEQSDLAGHVVETANDFLHSIIIGIRRGSEDILTPDHEEQIHLHDRLLLAHSFPSENEKKSTNKRVQKIVLIDDNPVIRRLYTRLFQKAGFHLLTAENGTEGQSLVLKEKPDCAIVDLQLPDISGLEVCRAIRLSNELEEMKLFLFTANEDQETREGAIEAGVDRVVIKSPDAAEIVETVKNSL